MKQGISSAGALLLTMMMGTAIGCGDYAPSPNSAAKMSISPEHIVVSNGLLRQGGIQSLDLGDGDVMRLVSAGGESADPTIAFRAAFRSDPDNRNYPSGVVVALREVKTRSTMEIGVRRIDRHGMVRDRRVVYGAEVGPDEAGQVHRAPLPQDLISEFKSGGREWCVEVEFRLMPVEEKGNSILQTVAQDASVDHMQLDVDY